VRRATSGSRVSLTNWLPAVRQAASTASPLRVFAMFELRMAVAVFMGVSGSVVGVDGTGTARSASEGGSPGSQPSMSWMEAKT
jgi:hypothetical protein